MKITSSLSTCVKCQSKPWNVTLKNRLGPLFAKTCDKIQVKKKKERERQRSINFVWASSPFLSGWKKTYIEGQVTAGFTCEIKFGGGEAHNSDNLWWTVRTLDLWRRRCHSGTKRHSLSHSVLRVAKKFIKVKRDREKISEGGRKNTPLLAFSKGIIYS